MGVSRDKIDFYSGLAIMLDAGLSIHDALGRPVHGRFKKISARIAERISEGEQFWEAVSSEKTFTHFERSLIKVGECSGSLPRILRSLAEWFETQRQLQSSLLLASLYPLFLYHFAGLIFAVISYFAKSSQSSSIILNLIIWFSCPWIAYLLCRLLGKLLPGILLNALPIVGDIIFKVETAFFFRVLGLSLNAGLGAVNSIALAANCCHNAYYRRRYLKVAEMVQSYSCGITSAFGNYMNFREKYSPIPTLMASAEMSGTLPEACERISNMQQEAAKLKLTLLAKSAPVLLYLAICVYIGYKIITFYAGMFSQIESLF